jgi:hypothetical protein
MLSFFGIGLSLLKSWYLGWCLIHMHVRICIHAYVYAYACMSKNKCANVNTMGGVMGDWPCQKPMPNTHPHTHIAPGGWPPASAPRHRRQSAAPAQRRAVPGTNSEKKNDTEFAPLPPVCARTGREACLLLVEACLLLSGVWKPRFSCLPRERRCKQRCDPLPAWRPAKEACLRRRCRVDRVKTLGLVLVE